MNRRSPGSWTVRGQLHFPNARQQRCRRGFGKFGVMTSEGSVDATLTGRPRDPEMDSRVLAAAAEVFADDGWGKFTVDAVARRAAVGKASIYLRWPNKQALLLAALEALIPRVTDIDTGSVRDDLVMLAEQILNSYFDESGRATIRLMIEADRVPEMAEHVAQRRQTQILAGRAIIRRAIARGELPSLTSRTLILDTICWPYPTNLLATPVRLRTKVRAKISTYAAELVDFVLQSAKPR